jgi:hypothetical protein
VITRIGLVAGDIWNYLDSRDKAASLEDVIVSVNKGRDIILMSIGWLAREGHITLEGSGPDYLVRLT